MNQKLLESMKNNVASQSPADILTSHVTGAVAKKKGAVGGRGVEPSYLYSNDTVGTSGHHDRGNRPGKSTSKSSNARVTNFSSTTPNPSATMLPPPKRKLQFEQPQSLGGNTTTKSTPNLRADESLKVTSPFQTKRPA